MRNRFYAMETGRFISEDPIGLAGGDISFYRYVKNDPVNWVDSDGKTPIVAIIGIGGLVGGTSQAVTTAFLPNSNFGDVVNAFGAGFLMGVATTAGAGLGPPGGVLFGIGAEIGMGAITVGDILDNGCE